MNNGLMGANKRFVAVVSGANMNFDRLRFVAERAEIGEGREALLSVEIPETPGAYVACPPPIRALFTDFLDSFIKLHSKIHPRAITEFIYRYSSADRAHVFMAFKLQTPDRAREVQMVLDELNKDGMTGIDISDDEMAKSHGRYMIGGPQNVPNERLFRFGESRVMQGYHLKC